MSPLTKIASFTALSLSLSLAGAGCLAEADPGLDEGNAEEIAPPAEHVGEAQGAWFPFFRHFFCPCSCCDCEWPLLGMPAPFFNGCGFPITR